MLLTKLLLEPEEELMSWYWSVKPSKTTRPYIWTGSCLIVTMFLAPSIDKSMQLEKQPTSKILLLCPSLSTHLHPGQPNCQTCFFLKLFDQHHQIISNLRLPSKHWKSHVKSLPRHSIDFWSRSFRSCLKSSGLSTFLRETQQRQRLLHRFPWSFMKLIAASLPLQGSEF